MIYTKVFNFEDLIDRYLDMLSKADVWDTDIKEFSYNHIQYMLSELSVMNPKSTKAHRWLGFVQAVLVMQGITTVDIEREVTRSAFMFFTGEE